MANIGLNYPVYKTATAQGIIGKAISADIAIETYNDILYGDDAPAEVQKGFKKGTLTMETTHLSQQAKADLLGHQLVGEELTFKDSDKPNNTGFGFYGVRTVENVVSYRAIWIWNIVFGEVAEVLNTKGENITYGAPKLVGEILVDAQGRWKTEGVFDTAESAKAWLNEKSGAQEQVSIPVASPAGGTYGSEQTVTLSCDTDAATIYYTTDGLTPTTGSTEYVGAITVADSKIIRAIAVKAGMNNSRIMSEEYIID